MSNMPFNSKHARVLRARSQKLFQPPLPQALFLFGCSSLLTGIILLVFPVALGWFLLAVSTLLMIVYAWYKGDLAAIPPLEKGDAPEDLLAADMLSGLTSLDTQHIAQTALKTEGYIFLNRRFGITESLVTQAVESLEADWWQIARELWRDIPNSDGIDGSYIIVALILSSSQKQKILNTAQVTEEDCVQALTWLTYWRDMYNTAQQRRASASIARDFAVGYTPMLNRFAYNVSRDIESGGTYHRSILGHPELVSRIHDSLVQTTRTNCMLVGDVGVGKSTTVEAFADSLLFERGKNSPLRFHQVYIIDTAGILTQMNSQNMLENALSSLVMEARHAKNIILFFPDIANLFGIEGGIDISATMLPFIQNGTTRMIFSATTGQWKWLQQNRPQLASLMNLQTVAPPAKKEVMLILENKVILIERQHDCLFTYNALKDIYRLADRYGPDVAMPAKAINLLEATARIGSSSVITTQTVAAAIEQTTGIKTGVAGAQEQQTLLGLDAQLHKRVIGQDEAISVIVSALQRSRAGVSNPNKPIGTFLLLGPTGVGKTETAKAVAHAYFGGEERLVRVDMNEYVTKDSIARFLNSGSTNSSSLLDTVRKQPFSVVLLDEIEKAHPDIVNSLLQMLDEGIMRDENNKPVSFKDAIIIATSNAGAQNIVAYEKTAETNSELAKQEFVKKLIQDGAFKPEFINRFDNVVMYKSLSPNQLEQVVDIQLVEINNVLAAQNLRVELSPEARSWLAQKGHDPTMGARPLRRLMQQTVESVISKKILENSIQSGSGETVTLDVSDLDNVL